MINKNIQLYSNDCSIYAIKNLLSFYNINENVNINLNENGVNFNEMEKTLNHFFYDVKSVIIDLNTIKEVKEPFILLLEDNKKIGHYVVVYKYKKGYFYILDSLFKKSYKIKDLSLISKGKAILVSNVKEKYYKKSNYNFVIIIFLSLVETLSLIGLSITLKSIIDDSFNNIVLYMLLELIILVVTFIKIKLFLKDFKKMDNNILNKYISLIYNLDDSFVKSHNRDEIYYRLFDCYNYKSFKLTLLFSLINDVLLFIFTIILLFYYSLLLGFIMLFIILLMLIIYIHIYNKISILIEKRRENEIKLYSHYINSFKEYYDNPNDNIINKTKELLFNYQNCDYELEKLNNKKNYYLLFFQSLLNIAFLLMYLFSFNRFMSIGTMITIINLINLILTPILSICSEISNYSNYKLIERRLNDLIINNKNIY